jgi:Transposase/TAP-like protein
MDVIVERVAALDVHKASVTVCVRIPAAGGGREPHLAEFQTTVRGLLGLRDWQAAHAVTQVVMEATGVYWKPVWHILEDDSELMLVNARHVKQVPGRKTDMSAAAWLCQLAEAGLLKANFVPPKPIRDLRQLTRYRKTQIAERQREAQRLHKALEDTNVKLDCVASDLLGASGRAMLDALVAGTTDPAILAELAKGRLRQKIPALREALEGRLVDYWRVLAGGERAFDERRLRELVRRDVERARDFAAVQNHDLMSHGEGSPRPLSSITAPTLVIHGTADPMFPLEHGRALAEEIRGARLLALEGAGVDRVDWDAIVCAILEHTERASGG